MLSSNSENGYISASEPKLKKLNDPPGAPQGEHKSNFKVHLKKPFYNAPHNVHLVKVLLKVHLEKHTKVQLIKEHLKVLKCPEKDNK